MKIKTKLVIILLSFLIGWTIILQTQVFKYPEPDEIERRTNYLQRVILNGPIDNHTCYLISSRHIYVPLCTNF